MADKNECIQVVVRMRPFNKKEKDEGCKQIVTVDLELNQIRIVNPEAPNMEPKAFTFDSVYDDNSIQRIFYEESCFGLIESVLEGFNGTIFAYGQTGCGKTFTMQGPPSPPEMRGVIPNSFSHIFDHIRASKESEYLVRCSYLEIYNEVIRDLLGDQKNPLKCDLKEDPQRGIIVSNLNDVVVESESELEAVLNKGLTNRTVGSTLMNSESSRSHSIFTIVVEVNNKDASGKDHIRAGKLNLVDLAGSERQKKTGATGERLKEGSKINLSLSALGNVISALSDGGTGKHIPYRDSKLTRMLQDSLGGNTKTLMVAAISPADYNYDETLSTLRYANRAKSIQNKPKINEDPKDAMLREFKEEIDRLKKLLSEQALNRENLESVQKTRTLNHLMSAEDLQSEVKIHSKSQGGNTSSGNTMSMDFASLVTGASPPIQEPKSEKSPRSSPRVKIEKQYIEVKVEVEKVSEEHLKQHRELQEYSQAIAEERDYVNEQLKEMESEVEKERRLRQELANRLAQLQSKLVGRNSMVIKGDESTEDIEMKQHEAELRQIERKNKAKKKLESKKIAESKLDGQEELKSNEDIVSDEDKRITKLKRKYEKKLQTCRAEIDDLHEEFQVEREQMLDTIREQDTEIKLYRQICLSLLDEKKLQQVVDKSQWDERNDEWVIPYIKTYKDSDLRLPDIDQHHHHNGKADSVTESSMQQESARMSSRGRLQRISNSDTEVNHHHHHYGKEKEPSARSSSRERGGKEGHQENGFTQLPPAAVKPPVNPKAQQKKEKSKENKEKDCKYTEDTSAFGIGKSAGHLSEWGFADTEMNSKHDESGQPSNSKKHKEKEKITPPNSTAHNSTSMDFGMPLALNHQEVIGDRQSSRQGSRRKKRTKPKGGENDDYQEYNSQSDGYQFSPRSNGVFLPQL